MDERTPKLTTPDGCETFAHNVEARLPELAQAARRRAIVRGAIRLKAEQHDATTVVEREALEAVYAYERSLSVKRGKKTRASRTWPLIEEYGVLAAVERIVNRPRESVGYFVLAEMGLADMAFEAVVLRHPESFSAEAVARSEERMQMWSRSRSPTIGS